MKPSPFLLITPADERFSHKKLTYHQTPIGNYYVPADAPRDIIIKTMRKGEIFEPAIIDVARKYIRRNSTVLDIGANLGQMSLLFSQFTGEHGRVYAFEADDYVFHILEQNIQANHAHNITPLLKAVYNTTGQALSYPVPDFMQFASYGSYGLNPRAGSGRTIESVRIDDMPIEGDISFMKIDVQGSDLFAMQGAYETIKKHRMPIVFEFEKQFQKRFHTCFQDYMDFIASINYRIEAVIYDMNYLIVPA